MMLRKFRLWLLRKMLGHDIIIANNTENVMVHGDVFNDVFVFNSKGIIFRGSMT